MKKLVSHHRAGRGHWVGDGFPVRTIFSPQSHGQTAISPFLLLDYAGPFEFPPWDQPRGVNEHPHKGFETVTLVYSGEVEHRDSTGGGGLIGPGDVQWMTAASGLVHEEKHGQDFTRRGGLLEMVQIWVNLPARDKSSKPGYQSIAAVEIPTVALPDQAGLVRVIAGRFDGTVGPARTFTPIDLWDLRLNAGHQVELRLPNGHNTLVFVRNGRIEFAGGEPLQDADLAVLDRQGDSVVIKVARNANVLIMSGEPIDEPVVAHGPFVMNTDEEIHQAFEDFQSGRMGRLEP